MNKHAYVLYMYIYSYICVHVWVQIVTNECTKHLICIIPKQILFQKYVNKLLSAKKVCILIFTKFIWHLKVHKASISNVLFQNKSSKIYLWCYVLRKYVFQYSLNVYCTFKSVQKALQVHRVPMLDSLDLQMWLQPSQLEVQENFRTLLVNETHLLLCN